MTPHCNDFNVKDTVDSLSLWQAELHDTAAQYLAAAIWTTESLQRYREQWSADACGLFDQLTSQLRTAHREVRRLLTDAPPSLFQHGCQYAFESLIENLQTVDGPELKETFTPDAIQCCEHAPEAIRWTLYRVMQEAVTNANQHSNASYVNICLFTHEKERPSEDSDDTVTQKLQRETDRIILVVADNGKGLVKQSEKNQDGVSKEDGGAKENDAIGYGLKGIQARVARLHGFCEIGLRQSGGTQIRVELPVTGMRMDSEPI